MIWRKKAKQSSSRGEDRSRPSLTHRRSLCLQNMSIFYRDHLGLYPFISRDGTEVNGGLPQNADLGAHLALAEGQIARRLRSDFTGLAVVDWEDWRPMWARNFGAKAVYRRRSKRRVRRERLELAAAAAGKEEVVAEARREFEEGARQLMGETLRLGVTSRPGGLWGFYGLPACYNEPKGGRKGRKKSGRKSRLGGEKVSSNNVKYYKIM